MLNHYLLKCVEKCSSLWNDRFKSLQTPDEIYQYQKQLQKKFISAIGGFPERSALNSNIVGSVARKGFMVEKIIFESMPKFYITAALFLPDSSCYSPPYPAVLVACGHSELSKAYSVYQQACVLLALNGVAALIYDPIDQGERLQYIAPNEKIQFWGVKAHNMVGLSSVLLGQNIARFMIFDAIRCLDYLETRNDIDSSKFGVMGNSGGGTLTSYLLSLDDRIKSAAPSCYITTFDRLLITQGPQDAEQNIFGQLQDGITHADYLMMRAPIPVLVCAATNDFFDIHGTWQSYRSAKILFTKLGFPEKIGIVEDQTSHGWSERLQLSSVAWMLRWLCNRKVSVPEIGLETLSIDEMQCTPKGQVLLIDNAKSVYDFNRSYLKKFIEKRKRNFQDISKVEFVKQICKITGISRFCDVSPPKVVSSDMLTNHDFKVEKLVIEPEVGVDLPALKYSSIYSKAKNVMLYLNSNGKKDPQAQKEIEEYLSQGLDIVAVDLRGLEARQHNKNYFKPYFGDDDGDFYIAYLLGKSYVGMRTNDILSCAKLLSNSYEHLLLYAWGSEVGIPALHAIAMETEIWSSAIIKNTLKSWSSIIENSFIKFPLVNIVHNSLSLYDLPDLVEMAGVKLILECECTADNNLPSSLKS